MCGIVAYLGKKEAYPILIKGLKRLEYRGYDSAGIALLNGQLNVYKRKGKVQELENFVGQKSTHGSIGIGHTRWATHGKPDDTNAHPHTSSSGRLTLVHNGIIENYAVLKEALKKLGHTFHSETDTEVLVNLIEEVQNADDLSLEEAVRVALTKVVSINNELQTPFIQELEMEIEALEKGGYDYFMLKEIHEQTHTIAECMRGRLNAEESWVSLGGVQQLQEKMLNADRFIIVSCGTSWHAGLIGEYLFEDLVRIPVEVEYASEFRYRNPVITEKDVVIAISQSGETADTLAALKLAKEKGAATFGIVNVVGSSIARFTDAGCYIHVGPEIGVASTKAFTGQVTLLTMLALMFAKEKKSISDAYFNQLVTELAKIPEKVGDVLAINSQIQYIAGEIQDAPNALYLGRGYNFPVALEGALKLKEISYIHAEGLKRKNL